MVEFGVLEYIFFLITNVEVCHVVDSTKIENCIDFISKLDLQKCHYRFKELKIFKKSLCLENLCSNPFQQILLKK